MVVNFRLLISLLVLVAFVGSAQDLPANNAPLKIAVAANFKPLLKQLQPQFEQQYAIPLVISSASTGILYAQISNGAPFDVFLAADQQRPLLLEQQDQIVIASRHTYAVGKLVLWLNDHDATSTAIPDQMMLSQWREKIAVANAKTAPYGLAAKSVLQKLGWWQSKRGQLVTGSNIAQTHQFVSTGGVKLGFVALSQVLVDQAQSEQKLQYWLIPSDWYPPIEQQLVILKRSEQQNSAKILVNWLLSAKIQQQIMTAGYGGAADP